MSASPLQPLPSATPSLASGSQPLPAASTWGGSPVPAEKALIPVGRLVQSPWTEIPREPRPTAPSAPVAMSPFPAAGAPSLPPAPAPIPLAAVPAPVQFPTVAAVAAQPLQAAVPVFQAPAAPEVAPISAPVAPRQARSIPTPTVPETPDFTDNDLREAFAPIFKGITIQTAPIDLQLEPMLRATIRRALAEYSPTTGRPFTNPGLWDRFVWRMRALFTSRSYEDILFEKTNRFQVDEVFLLDATALSLVSYASTNPGRHASAKRVEGTVHRLALQLRDGEGNLRRYFKLPDDRNVIVREGAFITLLAVFRGMPNEMAINDLGYTLGSIEERFADRYRIPGSPLLQLLQPFLEDCLLIQAPATAA